LRLIDHAANLRERVAKILAARIGASPTTERLSLLWLQQIPFPGTMPRPIDVRNDSRAPRAAAATAIALKSMPAPGAVGRERQYRNRRPGGEHTQLANP
jgi:hypothetical protein